MREIDGPAQAWFVAVGKRYEYTSYGRSEFYFKDKNLVDAKTRVLESLNQTVSDLHRAAFFEKPEGTPFFEDWNKQPLIVWRRRVNTNTDQLEKKVTASARFIIIPPQEADKVLEYLNAEQQEL